MVLDSSFGSFSEIASTFVCGSDGLDSGCGFLAGFGWGVDGGLAFGDCTGESLDGSDSDLASELAHTLGLAEESGGLVGGSGLVEGFSDWHVIFGFWWR